VQAIIARNEVVVYFLYGLAYFSLGTALLTLVHRPSRLPLIKVLPWLAAYGILQALFQWLNVLRLLTYGAWGNGDWQYFLARTTVLAVSVSTLLRFSVEYLARFHRSWGKARKAPQTLLVAAMPVYALLVFSYDPAGAARILEVFVRYSMYVPACVLTAAAFYAQFRALHGRRSRPMGRYMLPVSGLFLAKALFAGLLVSPMAFFPASVINQDSFSRLTGFPPVVPNALVSVGITTFVLLGMRVFDEEAAAERERHSGELRQLERLTAKVAQARTPDKVMPEVLEELLTFMSLTAGAVLIRDPNTQGLSIEAGLGLAEELAPSQLNSLVNRGHSLFDTAARKCAVIFGEVGRQPEIMTLLADPAEHLSFAIVPLAAKRECVGVLLVFSSRDKVIPPEDQRLLRSLGTQLGIALDDAMLEEQRRIAQVLQQSLLTPTPKIEGLEIAVQYEAATRDMIAGGDFYDFVELRDGRLAVVCGDVSGKGLHAAALTARVKNVMRAFLYEDASPASVLYRTNEVLCQSTTFGEFVTALVIVIDLDYSITYAHAGHPPLLLTCPTCCCYLLGGRGLPLGAFEGTRYGEERDVLPRLGSLVLYTDGLTEARSDSDLFGEERLLELVRSFGPSGAAQLAAGIVGRTMEFTGGRLQDDLAVIALRRVGERMGAARMRLLASELNPSARAPDEWVDSLSQEPR